MINDSTSVIEIWNFRISLIRLCILNLCNKMKKWYLTKMTEIPPFAPLNDTTGEHQSSKKQKCFPARFGTFLAKSILLVACAKTCSKVLLLFARLVCASDIFNKIKHVRACFSKSAFAKSSFARLVCVRRKLAQWNAHTHWTVQHAKLVIRQRGETAVYHPCILLRLAQTQSFTWLTALRPNLMN